MAGNRRDFIKTTAAATVLAASPASAQLANMPWIGFIHSTRLDEAWQLAFLAGLRDQRWEGDPSEDLQAGMQRIGIKKFEAGSRYRRGNIGNLSRAVKNTIAEFGAQLKFIVTAGGMVSGLAAAGIAVPCLVLMGRFNDFGAQRVGGYFFDVMNGAINVNLNKKIDLLHDPSTYAVAYSDMCLLYNDNSDMGLKEKKEWVDRLHNDFGVATPQVVDVTAFGETENPKIKINKAINHAIKTLNAKAIVVSGDPHLTTKRSRIVSAAGKRVIMCYPFQEYVDEAKEDGVGTDNYMAYGPKLETAYKQLGNLAGRLLTNPAMGLSLSPIDPIYDGKS